jgi:hypothetical protein
MHNGEREERERASERDREKEWIVSSAPLRTIMCIHALYRTILDHLLDTYCIRIQLTQDNVSCTNLRMRCIYRACNPKLSIILFYFFSISVTLTVLLSEAPAR